MTGGAAVAAVLLAPLPAPSSDKWVAINREGERASERERELGQAQPSRDQLQTNNGSVSLAAGRSGRLAWPAGVRAGPLGAGGAGRGRRRSAGTLGMHFIFSTPTL